MKVSGMPAVGPRPYLPLIKSKTSIAAKLAGSLAVATVRLAGLWALAAEALHALGMGERTSGEAGHISVKMVGQWFGGDGGSCLGALLWQLRVKGISRSRSNL